ncbi:MAG: Gfo/Idh/MocA family oxidoreductase [Candidatus Thorarchaeota archaeon]|nr:Gfo/Idh/MocA family oxidoreductase [Candidatus Thorarchaeota archaeon]
MQRINVGLVGVGNIGNIHLISLAALKDSHLLDLDITALCDIDEEALDRAANLYDVPTTYGNYDDIVLDDDVDVIYVCTPTNRHSDIVKTAAEQEKDIFCEKPLAHSAPQARHLLGHVNGHNIRNGVGLVLRYDQLCLYAKQLIQDESLGKPMLAHIRDDQHFPIDYIYYSKWRGDKSIAGGGTLIEHSIHDLDLLRWLFGDVQDVFGRVSFFSEREVEDHASVTLTHTNGAVSTLDSLWHWIDRPNERFIELFFQEGYIAIDLGSDERYLKYHLKDERPARVSVEDANSVLLEELGLEEEELNKEQLQAITDVGPERYSALSYAFLKSVTEGEDTAPSFIDAIKAHQLVDAAYKSADNDRLITL